MSKTKNTLKKSALTVIGMLCFMLTSVHAQELPFNPEGGHTPEYNPNIIYEQPEAVQSDNNREARTDEIQIRSTRTTATKPKGNPKSEKKEKANEEKKTSTGPTPGYENTNNDGSESVLSFNFLFYMIQKFKFTDVVDQ